MNTLHTVTLTREQITMLVSKLNDAIRNNQGRMQAEITLGKGPRTIGGYRARMKQLQNCANTLLDALNEGEAHGETAAETPAHPPV